MKEVGYTLLILGSSLLMITGLSAEFIRLFLLKDRSLTFYIDLMSRDPTYPAFSRRYRRAVWTVFALMATSASLLYLAGEMR